MKKIYDKEGIGYIVLHEAPELQAYWNKILLNPVNSTVHILRREDYRTFDRDAEILTFYESIDGQNEGTDYVIVSSYSLQEFMDSAIELQKVMLELYKAEKGKQE